MRPAHEASGGHSSTPIYDALYSEFRRAFRTLPGDRSGEEDLGFKGFGTGLHRAHPGAGWQPYPTSRPNHGNLRPALPPAPRRGV
ncbi:hypothetical protein [Streptomyces sp. NPDC020681]|uniref:hypothetical protein n=1 Tax=Streptomyces sp. NPDC020681 TaxID=3365083 RepID=UPI0037902BAE